MIELKFGIIGYGKIGRLRKSIIEEHKLGKVIALSDPFYDFKEEKDNYEVFTDYNELLKTDINCVVIATPNHITPLAVIAALKAGKHIFCEKPPGRNLNDVLEIEKAYNETKGLKLKFGFNHREHESVINAYRIMKSGRMGRLMWARGLYGKSGGVNFTNEWRSNKDMAGGGILLDQGIHMIDLLNYFFGGFNEVKSFVSQTYWDIPLEDNAFILLKNDNNQFASFHSSSTQWKHIFRLELFFTEGYMVLSGLLTGSRSYGRETLIIARRQFEDEIEVAGNPDEEEIFFDKDRSFEREMIDFYDAFKENRDIVKGNIQDAIKAMELIDRIYKSDPSWMDKLTERN